MTVQLLCASLSEVWNLTVSAAESCEGKGVFLSNIAHIASTGDDAD